ncbi:hypothetical protein L6468_08745 [Prevotella communis]|uniref:hypothetical protein n=1 Tax=Prevotella communis TaxID=2913614 RepID=UPI001EDC228B|nr:hypothetical protein [Prevotella communis]UKK61092.1 hypothetical protein L6468_08745 [Prevotella communis]UKK63917.1 hypothetical protein L6473_08755 [Prevotella communis]
MKNQVEQFKAEIEKVKLIIQSNRAQGAFAEGYLIGQESVLEHFDRFVKSIQEEPVSEDLDVIAREYAGIPCDAPKDLTYCVHDKKAKYDAVLFGAQWQKQQMIKNAFPAEIGKQRSDYKCVLHGNFFKHNAGDKVKLIII